jgi:hypothetical protein
MVTERPKITAIERGFERFSTNMAISRTHDSDAKYLKNDTKMRT